MLNQFDVPKYDAKLVKKQFFPQNKRIIVPPASEYQFYVLQFSDDERSSSKLSSQSKTFELNKSFVIASASAHLQINDKKDGAS